MWKSCRNIEEEVKQLYETFLRQCMTELTDALKREHRQQKSVTFASKSLMTQGIQK